MARSVLASGSAALAFSLGGVVHDPGGSRFGMGHGELVAIVLVAALVSLLFTRRDPLRSPLVHVALVTVSSLLVGVVSMLSGVRGMPALSLEAVAAAVGVLGVLLLLAVVVTAKSVAVGGTLFFVVDRWLVRRQGRSILGGEHPGRSD
jgi:FtsH-binding integral membrane protein